MMQSIPLTTRLNQNILQYQVRVPVSQAGFNLVREEAGAQLYTKDNKHLTSYKSKHLCEGECCK